MRTVKTVQSLLYNAEFRVKCDVLYLFNSASTSARRVSCVASIRSFVRQFMSILVRLLQGSVQYVPTASKNGSYWSQTCLLIAIRWSTMLLFHQTGVQHITSFVRIGRECSRIKFAVIYCIVLLKDTLFWAFIHVLIRLSNVMYLACWRKPSLLSLSWIQYDAYNILVSIMLWNILSKPNKLTFPMFFSQLDTISEFHNCGKSSILPSGS